MQKHVVRISIIVILLIGIAVALNWDYIVLRTKYAFYNDNTGDIVVQDTQQQTEPNWVRIPSLNIEAPIKFVTDKKEATFQAALATGVVHYPDTAQAGQAGNMYIFGHSSDLPWTKGEYKTVFALLPQIKIGAEIFVSDSQGKEYKYTAVSTKVVQPTDLSVLDQYNNEQKLLTVQTSYPVGTALRRFIVTSELVE